MFLQDRFASGLSPSTLKVYVAAFAAYHYHAPFEPLESVSDQFLTLKTVFPLAISSLKRVGDLQALSVSPSCLEFAPGMVKAFLYPKPGYVPKVPTNIPQPIVLQALCPPPFKDLDQEKLNLICPVRALRPQICPVEKV